MIIPESELILNKDGSVYHLKLLPEEIGETIILVGDQKRVAKVSKHLDSIESKKSNREFVTHTGWLGKKKISVISTGIGTDNIDIVLNELDALVNVDLSERTINKKLKKLNFIRIGTSGTFQEDVEVDSFLVSEMAVGFDALLHFYENPFPEREKLKKSIVHYCQKEMGITPYLSYSDEFLTENVGKDFPKGVTVTCPGFYAPQGRQLRAVPKIQNLLNKLSQFELEGKRFTNFEMETAGIYGMSNVLGHRAISFNAILANRSNGKFSNNPNRTIKHLIEKVFERLHDSKI